MQCSPGQNSAVAIVLLVKYKVKFKTPALLVSFDVEFIKGTIFQNFAISFDVICHFCSHVFGKNGVKQSSLKTTKGNNVMSTFETENRERLGSKKQLSLHNIDEIISSLCPYYLFQLHE